MGKEATGQGRREEGRRKEGRQRPEAEQLVLGVQLSSPSWTSATRPQCPSQEAPLTPGLGETPPCPGLPCLPQFCHSGCLPGL